MFDVEKLTEEDAMTTLRERAESIHHIVMDSPLEKEDEIAAIERYLDDACKEAVREERKKWTCTCPKEETAAQQNEREKVHAYYEKAILCVCKHIQEDVIAVDPRCPKHGANPNRPKAEDGSMDCTCLYKGCRVHPATDALKAATRIATMMGCSKPEEWNDFIAGCNDLLNGWRDTAAARTITGEVK